MLRHCVTLFTLLCVASSAGAQAADNKSLPMTHESRLAARVDKLFAKWNRRDTPGGVVAVLQDGKIVYERGYGMANLEYAIPNRPTTLFHIASISKQFTAFAMHLLAQDGKLSLDDDVRKYVPELPDFGKTITIRHLLQHTSGLRDQVHLLWLAGWRFEDAITEADELHLVSQQRELNFAPGEEYLYCNTGFTLLAVIVKRVSGKSLNEFAQERIFKPLGMKHTLFPADYSVILKNRAYSYQPRTGGGYQYLALSDSTVGPTGVVTNVKDMALWEQNFYTGQVGGKALLAAMQQKGRLNNGQEIAYGSGLDIGEYRGLKTVWHSGAIAGHRTFYVRFPERHFAVIVLTNTNDINAEDISYRVAEIYLATKLRPQPAQAAPAPTSKPVEVQLDPKLLDAYAGDYEFKPGNVVTITRVNRLLMAQGTGSGKVPIYPSSQTTFFLKNADAQLTFVKPDAASAARTVVLHMKNGEQVAKRIERAPLTDFVGEFYSEELNVLYTVTLREGKLFLRHPRGEVEMVFTLPDTFTLPFPFDTLRYTRSDSKRCNGFTIDDGRVRNLRFVKVEIKPIE